MTEVVAPTIPTIPAAFRPMTTAPAMAAPQVVKLAIRQPTAPTTGVPTPQQTVIPGVTIEDYVTKEGKAGKSIVLRGKEFCTTYSVNLTQLGGRFMRGLVGGSGWNFKKVLQPKLEAFLVQAAAGQVTAAPKVPKDKDVRAPQTQGPNAPVFTGVGGIGGDITPGTVPTQIVTYTVPLPSVGMNVAILTHGGTLAYTVIEVKDVKEKKAPEVTEEPRADPTPAPVPTFVDTVIIAPRAAPTTQPSTLVILNGQWQVYGLMNPHQIVFN